MTSITQDTLFSVSQSTQTKIELAFDSMVLHHETFSKSATGCNEVLQFLLDHPEKIWWWSWELNGQVNSKGAFLSHRACARASDLAIFHPELVEDRKIGRFKVYRIKLENSALVGAYLKGSK